MVLGITRRGNLGLSPLGLETVINVKLSNEKNDDYSRGTGAGPSFFHVKLKLQTWQIILKKSECFPSELFVIKDAAFSAAAVTQTSDM